MVHRLVVEPNLVDVLQQESGSQVAEREELEDPEDAVDDLLLLRLLRLENLHVEILDGEVNDRPQDAEVITGVNAVPVSADGHRGHDAVLLAGEALVDVHRQPELHAPVPVLHRLAERPALLHAGHVNVLHRLEVVLAALRLLHDLTGDRLGRSVAAPRLQLLRVRSQPGAGANALGQDDAGVDAHPEDEEARPHVEQPVKPRAAQVELVGHGVADRPDEGRAEMERDVHRHPLELPQRHLPAVGVDGEREVKVIVERFVRVVRTCKGTAINADPDAIQCR